MRFLRRVPWQVYWFMFLGLLVVVAPLLLGALLFADAEPPDGMVGVQLFNDGPVAVEIAEIAVGSSPPTTLALRPGERWGWRSAVVPPGSQPLRVVLRPLPDAALFAVTIEVTVLERGYCIIDVVVRVDAASFSECRAIARIRYGAPDF